MPHGEVRDRIPASASAVFELLHDYTRRLEWDTLLQRAFLHDEFPKAAKGAISTCQGRPFLGGIALTTEYIRFARGEVAAIRMLNRPIFFESFAASIRHDAISDSESTITYKFRFTARPKWLRWILHPIMSVVFRFETKKRLSALRQFFETQSPRVSHFENPLGGP